MITKNTKKRIITSIVLLMLVILITVSKISLVFLLLCLGVLSILEFLNISKKIFKKKFNMFLVSIFFIIFVFLFCYLFYVFSLFYQFKVILYSLLIGCIASDIGGFMFGKIFKGPKLTKISPNKTISGAIGSLILSVTSITGLIFYFAGYFNFKILFIGLITSIFSQLGDLFFSLLKRKAKIKDTGNIFPGHGGALDRLDGIFVGLPIGFLALILII